MYPLIPINIKSLVGRNFTSRSRLRRGFLLIPLALAWVALFYLFGGLAISVQAQSNDVQSEQPAATNQAGFWETVHSITKLEALIGFLVGVPITFGLISLSQNSQSFMGALLALSAFVGTLMCLVRLLFIWP